LIFLRGGKIIEKNNTKKVLIIGLIVLYISILTGSITIGENTLKEIQRAREDIKKENILLWKK